MGLTPLYRRCRKTGRVRWCQHVACPAIQFPHITLSQGLPFPIFIFQNQTTRFNFLQNSAKKSFANDFASHLTPLGRAVPCAS